MVADRGGPLKRTLRVSLAVLLFASVAARAGGVTLRNGVWSVAVDPGTLAVVATPTGAQPIPVSGGQGGLGRVEHLVGKDTSVEWTYAEKGVSVAVRIEGDTIAVRFNSAAEGRFRWPVVPGGAGEVAYVLPCFEGLYVPAGDGEWAGYLAGHSPMDTTADLSMPFWGVEWAGHTLTYLLVNPFRNELAFTDEGGKVGVGLTHAFRGNWKVKEYEVRVSLGPATPIEPALRYRRYLKETGQFVSLKEKIEKRPEAGKLLGAPCVYLWGGDLLGREDVTDYKRLAGEILKEARGEGASPGKRIWGMMSAEGRKVLEGLPKAEWVDRYMEGVVCGELSRMLGREDFYDRESWGRIEGATGSYRGKAGGEKPSPRPSPGLPGEGTRGGGEEVGGAHPTGEGSVVRRNCELLEGAFPGCFGAVGTWGDGVSGKMVRRLRGAGLDRVRIVVSEEKDLRDHPDAVEAAREERYLIGPYDSFHSIHKRGEAGTWGTAQFEDAGLYEAGAIVGRDGRPLRGFKQKGHLLSPIAGRAAVERRVGEWVKGMPGVNLWFVDCDAFGQLYDDYSPAHPATQREDMEARLSRLKWLGEKYGFVVGSEGGSSYAAGVVDFAEGVETPALGWGDKDLQTDKGSPYYLGGYYPPDGPAIFFKQVPLKPGYEKFFFDPRYRVPLYQVALHDSVVATHHWSFGSFKLKGLVGTREMLELLYGVPPLYHLNPGEFEQRRGEIARHYAFFSPLHREVGMLPMTDFAYLTGDRMVQRTRFGEGVEVVANFSGEAYEYGGRSVPGRSVMCVHSGTGEVGVYRVSE